MEAEHLLTVPVCSDSVTCTASAVGLSGPEPVVATATSDGRLQIHYPFRKARGESSWSAAQHTGLVELLAFSPSSSPLQLASVSRDLLVLWRLEGAFPLSPSDGPPCQAVALTPLCGSRCLESVCLNSTALYLALCAGSDVFVFSTQKGTEENTLSGHLSPITHAIFHPHHSHTLITTSQDRTFKVWDVAEGCVVYQSPVMSASPLTCVAVDPDSEVLAVTAANGKLWQLDMSPRGGYRTLLQCDVWRERDRFLAHHEGGEREEDEDGDETEAGTAVLGLHYWSSSSSLSLDQRFPKEISEAVLDTGRLLVAGHSSILALDTNTLQAVGFLEFRDPIPSCVVPPLTVLPVAASSSMTTCPTDNQVYSVLNGMFENTVSLLTLSLPPNKREKHGQEINEQMLSFLSRAPLSPNSVLRSEFIPKPRPEATKLKQSTGAVGRKKNGRASGGAVADKPLTFRNKVKSSGYTVPPRMKRFTPSTGGRSKTKTPAPPKTRERKLYPLERGAPAHVLCRLQPASSPTSLTSLSFSGDGGYVSCGAADRAVYLLRLPPSQGKIQALTGHDGTVQSVDWSHSGDLLLTGSADRTAKLWTPTQKDPLLTISQSQSTSKLKSTAGGSGFPAAISRAVFYYLDKFLLLSSSNSLHLYKYHIDTQPTDDIKRYLNSSGYKLVQTLPMERTQSITCMVCINEFLSHLVVVGGSNKSVDVIDMNVGRSVRYMGDCHTRPPHWAGLNKGSRGVAHPSWAYDLFLTAAPTDGVKLWDLRSNRCVRCLSAHVNRCHAVTAEFSPCSRFIATGSEDRSAYIYDLRTLSPLHKLSGHSDTVNSVTFHPLSPMLATATINGQVTFFTADSQTV